VHGARVVARASSISGGDQFDIRALPQHARTSNCTEPLDADWLARFANDTAYTTTGTDSDAMNGAGVSPGQIRLSDGPDYGTVL
jgi:hypothetical protein